MKRSSPLKRGAPPQRTTRLRAKGKSRFPKRRNQKYCAWIRTGGGCYAGTGWDRCEGPIECAHVKSRGAGGDDVGNCVPLCRYHHRAQHTAGWFEGVGRWKVEAEKYAKQLADRYRETA